MAIHYVRAEMRLSGPKEPLVETSKCLHGTFMYFPHDTYLGGAMKQYGEYAQIESEVLMKYVNSGDVVVEVGANMGCHTIALAKKVTDTGRVFAFEPQRVIYQMLCGNLALNEVWNVLAGQCAVGDHDGVLYVPPINYAVAGNFGGVELKNSEGEPVQLLALDTLQLNRCDLIKIDVEGMELDVLEGARSTIEQYRPVLYVENDREEKKHPLCDYLTSINYDYYWHLPKLFNEQNFKGKPENDYGDVVSINMLCFPKEKHVVPPHFDADGRIDG